jgi:signal transduction histidine kinase
MPIEHRRITARSALPFVGVFLAYVATARLGLRLDAVGGVATPVWPPTGIALAALFLSGARLWPAVALAALIANVSVGVRLPVAAAIAVGNTLEAVLGAALLRRVGFQPALARLRDVAALVLLGAIASTTVSATFGLAATWLGGAGPPATLWPVWWLGDAMGDMIVAPLLFTWLSAPPPRRLGAARLVEAAMVALVVVVTGHAIFGTLFQRARPLAFPYMVFPGLIWATLRFGQRGSSTVSLVTAAFAVWGTTLSQGPFVVGSRTESLMLLQLFMAVVATTGLTLGATIEERRRVERERNDAFERERAARAEAEAANRTKDEFLAMLGHELRNPLAPIVTALQLLRMQELDGGQRERDVIERQVQHMLRLVDDLLDVSRITRGKIELKKSRVSVADVMGKALELAGPLVEQRGLHLELSQAPDLFVDGDATRLTQVLTNLLTNAAKYTDPGGRIAVTTAREGEEVVVRVRDSGIGIASELLPRIFDRFVQGAQNLDRAQGGLGLGLTIAHTLVTLHGGTLEAHSDGVGRGSEFVIRLATSTAAPSEPLQAPGSGPVAAAGRRVLIVDDNTDAADTLAELLGGMGHHTHVAYDGLSALQAAPRFAPEIALVDIGLPVMDGYELARRLRRELQRCRLVAVTGYGQEDDRRRSFAAGFDEHLVKPVRAETLRRVMERVLDSRA